jgi:acetyl esterase/lipase
LGPVPTPSAVVAAYPVVNPADSYDHGVPSGSDPKTFIGEYLGGAPSQHLDRLVAISSLSYASANAPPTLILEPERDDFIPAQGVYEVADLARARGVRLTLDRIPFAHHLFDGLPGTLGEQVKRSIVFHYLQGLRLAP